MGFVVGFMVAVQLISWDLTRRPRPASFPELDPGTTAYEQNVSGVTLLNVPPSVHGEGRNARAFCFNDEHFWNQVRCNYHVTPDGTITFYWRQPFTGRILIAPRLKSEKE